MRGGGSELGKRGGGGSAGKLANDHATHMGGGRGGTRRPPGRTTGGRSRCQAVMGGVRYEDSGVWAGMGRPEGIV
jgi:hypothetical protein